jgi:hypothetical protein
MLGYGFGARTVEGDGPACNKFSMTGDFLNPFIDSEEELLTSYSNTLRSVKLALPVYFRDIIKQVCDLAQVEYGTAGEVKLIKNYYLLIIMMAGVIDDFEESLK